MSVQLQINREPFWVAPDEFPLEIVPPEISNLRIRQGLGLFERLASLIAHVIAPHVDCIIFSAPTHGGFLPITVAKYNPTLYEKIHLVDVDDEHGANIAKNTTIPINKYKAYGVVELYVSDIIRDAHMLTPNLIYLVKCKENDPHHPYGLNAYQLVGTPYWLYWNDMTAESAAAANILRSLEWCTKGDQLTYDNLLELCMIVKNAGPQFEDTLRHNLPQMDHWTIYDTGSTDGTQDIIRRVTQEAGMPPGHLYEDTIALKDLHFGRERNKCLDLAGTRCKYTVMLDDTYRLDGDLRAYMGRIRGDQFADTFSLFIQSNDMYYASNRIIKTSTGLRYMYRIHEVVSDKNNVNVVCPSEKVVVTDYRFDYMEKRTMDRKKYDIQWLLEELEANPFDPRAYYYLGQTYNLIKDHEKAFYYFIKRTEFANSGFNQERYDAFFEAARLANFFLGKPWEVTLDLYTRAIHIDDMRPEPYYFIGIHYLVNENNAVKALPQLRRAFELGFPVNSQYSLRPTLSYFFAPYYLTKICYECKEYALGERAAEYFITKYNQFPQSLRTNIAANPELNSIINNPSVIREVVSWYAIFKKINAPIQGPPMQIPVDKPIVVFVADGGFKPWSGSSLLREGVGGSETYIIEMARNLQRLGGMRVVVFCNCPTEVEIFEDVIYLPLAQYGAFITTYYVSVCIISRFSEYLPLSILGKTEKIYLVLHDLEPSGIVIPMHPKLRRIYCLSEWHVGYFTQRFAMLASITRPFYYGIDQRLFAMSDTKKRNVHKKPFSFIYSSFPNRGLLQLLQMWPAIYQIQPRATLCVYCDLDGQWVNQNYPEVIAQIRGLLAEIQQKDPENEMGVYVYGWVDKTTLANAWKQSDFWLYPCVFLETFCLTALEAAASQTFVVTNGVGALENTVGDRGMVIAGDPTTAEWRAQVVTALRPLLANRMAAAIASYKYATIERNYKWSQGLGWGQRAEALAAELAADVGEYRGEFCGIRYMFDKEWEELVGASAAKASDQCRNILEVNTFTGMGIFEIIRHFPWRNIAVSVVDAEANCWDSFAKNSAICNHIVFNTTEGISQISQKGVAVDIHKRTPQTLLNMYAKWAGTMHLISYFCLNTYDLTRDLPILYEYLCEDGLLLITVTNKATQLGPINWFCNTYKQRVLYELNKPTEDHVVLLQKYT